MERGERVGIANIKTLLSKGIGFLSVCVSKNKIAFVFEGCFDITFPVVYCKFYNAYRFMYFLLQIVGVLLCKLFCLYGVIHQL